MYEQEDIHSQGCGCADTQGRSKTEGGKENKDLPTVNLSLCLNQGLYLFSGYVDTVFEKTRQEVEVESLKDMLEKQATRHNFRTGMDWLLCRLYPKYEGECRLFYEGKGKSFKNRHPRLVERIDVVMAACLRESAKRAK